MGLGRMRRRREVVGTMKETRKKIIHTTNPYKIWKHTIYLKGSYIIQNTNQTRSKDCGSEGFHTMNLYRGQI